MPRDPSLVEFLRNLNFGLDSQLGSGLEAPLAFGLGPEVDSNFGLDFQLGSWLETELAFDFESEVDSNFGLASQLGSWLETELDFGFESEVDSNFRLGLGLVLGSGLKSQDQLEKGFDSDLC